MSHARTNHTLLMASSLAAAVTLGLAACSFSGAGAGAAAGAGTNSAALAPSASATPSAGASTGSSQGSADLDACSLLSLAQAGSLMGKTYGGTVAQTLAPGQYLCTYAGTNNGTSLTVYVYAPGSGITFDGLVKVLKSVGDTTPVSGIGDHAEAGLIEVDAGVGKWLFAVEENANITGEEAVAKAVATALSRL